MSFKIIWLKDGREISRTPWKDRQGAIDHAHDDFLVQQRQYGVTAVTVLDDTNTVIYRLGKDHNAKRP